MPRKNNTRDYSRQERRTTAAVDEYMSKMSDEDKLYYAIIMQITKPESEAELKRAFKWARQNYEWLRLQKFTKVAINAIARNDISRDEMHADCYMMEKPKQKTELSGDKENPLVATIPPEIEELLKNIHVQPERSSKD